jgi:hypothetical protein
LDPAALRVGADLVLDVAPAHGLALEHGVAIEDYFDQAARADIDREALAAAAAWREARGDDVLMDGIDLGYVAEVELLAGCFLPGTLIRRALAAIETRGRVEAIGFDAAALRALAGLIPPGCELSGCAAPPPPAPSRGGRRNALVAAAERTWIPAWPRGEVVCVPYWHLVGVYTQLARDRGKPRPVSSGMGLAGLRWFDVAMALARGGFGGSSGARARAAGAERVAALAERLARAPAGDDDVARALDGWALAVMARDAGAAPAQFAHFRDVVRKSRLIVMPFDSPGEQRVLLAAGRTLEIPALVVQHGFKAGLNDPDMTLSDHVAVWSEHDRGDLQPRARGIVTITGNPGADDFPPRREPGRHNRIVVLVEYHGRLSARVGQRIALQQLAAAVDAIGATRPGSEVAIRPHPSDHRGDDYLAALRSRADVRLALDASTPIEDLLASADVCVGALSTATLQAAALGVHTVFLDVSGATRPWPFDGAPGALPAAYGAQELAQLIEQGPAAADAAATALGLSGRATERIVDMIEALAGR